MKYLTERETGKEREERGYGNKKKEIECLRGKEGERVLGRVIMREREDVMH